MAWELEDAKSSLWRKLWEIEEYGRKTLDEITEEAKNAIQLTINSRLSKADVDQLEKIVEKFLASVAEEEAEEAVWAAAYKAGETGYLCCVDCKRVKKDTWGADASKEYVCNDCLEADHYNGPPEPKQCEWTYEERLLYDDSFEPEFPGTLW
jgi:hypothetical protein